MISFLDYVTQPPKILCGIARGKIDKNYLVEELHADPYHFIVPKKDHDKYDGTLVKSGVMHVKKFGHTDHWLVHRAVGSEPMMFTDVGAAEIHAGHIRNNSLKQQKQMHSTLMQHYAGTHNKYSGDLYQYGSASSHMNLALMSGDKPSTQALHLDHALKHQGTPDDMVVYSGISTNHATKVITSDVVHHPSFLSTSIDMNVAASFSKSQGSNHVLKIHVPAGHRGAYIGDLSGKNAHEKEFLLPRDLKLRFHRDKETIMKSPLMGDMHVHHATIENT